MLVSGQDDNLDIDAGIQLDCDVEASFDMEEDICAKDLTTFTALDSGVANTTYQWSFFNGETTDATYLGAREGQTIEFKFTSTGKKLVRLTITLPNGCSATIDEVIRISSNVISGGSIGSDESSCSAFDPAIITSVIAADGEDVEYIWLQSHQSIPPNDENDTDWEKIPNATGESYDPGPIEETTYFIRCSRNSFCQIYSGESNVVKKEINPEAIEVFLEYNEVICEDIPTEFYAEADTDEEAEYSWLFFNGPSALSLIHI